MIVIDKELLIALRCANQDIRERLLSVYYEVRHLQQNSAYFLKKSGLSELLAKEDQNILDAKQLFNPKRTEELSKLYRGSDDGHTDSDKVSLFIILAAEQINCGLKEDIDQARKLPKRLIKLAKQIEEKNNFIDCLLPTFRELIFIQAALRTRVDYCVRDLGKLQTRFGQELERIKPDSPGPTNLRRQENGITEKYLSEMTRWVHRDLIILVKKYFGAQYPYKDTPVTLQYWQYDYRSNHSAIRTSAQHNEWRSWVNNKKHVCDAFTKQQTYFIQQPFWAFERPAIHVTVAHELAHRVIRDTVGQHYLPAISNRAKTGKLGRLIRRVTAALEAWIVSYSGRSTRRLEQEIVADLLAVSRFGHAYLYAWFLEMLNSEIEVSDQLRDEHGWIEYCDVEKQSKNPVPFPSDWIPDDYLRGRVMLHWLALMEIQNDTFSLSLRKAIRTYLNLLHESRYQLLPDLKEYWKLCAKDLIDAAIKSGTVHDAKKLWIGFSTKENLDTVDACDNWFIFRQRIDQTLKISIASEINSAPEDIVSAPEVAWRAEWYNSIVKDTDKRASPSKLFNNVIDDYLYRTANPFRLKDLVTDRDKLECEELNNNAGLTATLSNTIDEAVHKRCWVKTMSILKEDGLLDSVKRPYDNQPTYDPNKFLGDTYNLELLVIAAPIGNNPLNTFHYIDEKWDIKGLKTFDGSQATLGRYDRYLLYKVTSAQPGDFLLEQTPCISKRKYSCYYARKRQLREILPSPKFPFEKYDQASKIVLFVSLKWFGYRLFFLEWLLNNPDILTQNLRANITSAYISNGWEDFVLFLAPDELTDCFRLVKEVYDLPMVKTTESIYTESIYESLPEKVSEFWKKTYQIVFLIRVKDQNCGFAKELQKKIDSVNCSLDLLHSPVNLREFNEDSVFLDHIFGDMDYAIEAPCGDQSTYQKLRTLLYSMTSISRVQTHIRPIERLT